ncbi:MAG: PQQ-binding-like beta-propeller repeat protein [Acidobacteria bacterium]|nr:PQQ-binding-like beta-propeller repeat protein [Acidobacteriota bacterium]
MRTRADRSHHGLPVAVLGVLAFAAGAAAPPPLQAQAPREFVPVTDAMLQAPSDDDWLMWRRTLDGWGYSPLDQIDRSNVGDLRLVWSRALSAGGRQQGTPLVYDGVLYMPNPSDVIQAIDAVTGDLIWEYRRSLPDDACERILPGVCTTNRNLAIYENLIIDTSVDEFIFALDARTGELVWETEVLDYTTHPANQSTGPIIVNGMAISGRSCMPAGGPDACVVTAHDARTGEELWRRRTIPRPGEPGDETWGGVPDAQRRHVGTWMAPSYDPALNLLFIGTSVTSPAPKFMIGGADNRHLYHNSTLALDADTGEIVWYYQHLNDHWDLDHPFERLLVDTVVRPDSSAVSWINPRLRPGEERQVMTGIPGKTGIVYTLDRATGEFLWATPTVAQNVVSGIDGATGAVSENPELVFGSFGQEVLACPTAMGGKDWEAGAYSPRTNTMYMPLRNACARMAALDDGARSLYSLSMRNELAPGTDQLGSVWAISAETGVTAWTHQQRTATMSLAATAGGLVFVGDVNGRFKALDDETGEVLWEVNLGSPVSGFPVTYAVGGRQYVVAGTGTGGNASRWTAMTPEIRPSDGNNIFVFALPE